MEKVGKKLPVLYYPSFSPTVREVEINAVKFSFCWEKIVLQPGAVHRKHNFSSFKRRMKTRLFLWNILNNGSNYSPLQSILKPVTVAVDRQLPTLAH